MQQHWTIYNPSSRQIKSAYWLNEEGKESPAAVKHYNYTNKYTNKNNHQINFQLAQLTNESEKPSGVEQQ